MVPLVIRRSATLLQDFRVPLHDEDFFLPEFFLEFFLDASEKTPCGSNIVPNDTVSDDLVLVSDPTGFPETDVLLRNESQAAELFEQPLPDANQFFRLNGRAIIVR